MESPLSFKGTEKFRKDLLVKNLPPYKTNNFSSVGNAGDAEFRLREFSVVDSPTLDEVQDVQEQKLYVKNAYGPGNSSGYGATVDINKDYGTQSNLGPYSNSGGEPGKTTEQSQKDAYIQNTFGPEDGYIYAPTIQNVHKVIAEKDSYFNYISSVYPLSSLFLNENPRGSNGSLAQDSPMIQIAAQSLRAELQYRIAQETYENTFGRVNLLDALKDPFQAAEILSGRAPLIDRDWQISVPGSLAGKGLDFLSRITGVYSPYSWIPGDYFAVDGKKSFINQTINLVGSLFGRPQLLPTTKNGSDIFLANTGQGSVSALFSALEYNNFRPDYKANFIGDLNLGAPKGNYYVGSRTQDPDNLVFPNNELPVDPLGRRIKVAVRGYSEVAKLYENNQNFNFGPGEAEPSAGAGEQGGFTWISPKTKGNAGKKVGQGGRIQGEDPNWPSISSQFDKSESTDFALRQGSIMDDTQRLVDAADGLPGNARLGHVGNAINQTSKVFWDGTREITKGSRVKRYVDQNGTLVGREYCRVFTKDTPYMAYNDLQKTSGNIRKFTYSVLDNTYNLNIAPINGDESTNIVDGQVKKYMLSLENLAWRSTDLQQDLPACEKGPNGGRIMWFPPYDLSVDESVSVDWNTNVFLGRPEPIYTYNNTKRTGSLKFKIVVDHPSILNVLVKKELQNVTPDSEVTKIIDSFFAGCKEYDIYDLAKKYTTLTFNEIFNVVEKTKNIEDFKKAVKQIPSTNSQQADEGESLPTFDISDLKLYFDNDVPDPRSTSTTSSVDYDNTFIAYSASQTNYVTNASENQKQPVQTFFDTEIIPNYNIFLNFLSRIQEITEQGYPITFTIQGSASSPNSDQYNLNLSARRVDSIIKSIRNYQGLNQMIDNGMIRINQVAAGDQSVGQTGIECQNTPTTSPDNVYSVSAMGCRRVQLTGIQTLPKVQGESQIQFDEIPNTPTTGDDNANTNSSSKTQTTQELELREGLSKKVLRRLLTECNYFDLIKEQDPFLYDSIEQKIAFFNPTFHSITPEGLNSRLTFLQQCLRPGNTIPTIGPDGKPLQNDALNTSFGAPPVCILRVGDFFHTKIVITQMSVQYEPLLLDINPEGIGVQPMLADVNLSFNFIGGHGLKEPVAQLQNALTFNYYANTEMYDERAVGTEDTTTFDLEVIEEILKTVPLANIDFGQQTQNEAGATIGNIQTKILSNSGTTITGTTSMTQIMNDLIDATKVYTDTTVSVLENINSSYLIGGLRMFTKDRKFITGNFGEYASNMSDNVSTNIFGKSDTLQSKIDQLFADAISDVSNNTSPLLVGFTNNSRDVTNKELRIFKKNLTTVIENKKKNFSAIMETKLNDLVTKEQELIRVVDKINFVQTETDGFKRGGTPIIYGLTATTQVNETSTGANNTLEEFVNDYKTVANNINTFYTNLGTNNIMTADWDNSLSFSFLNESISNSSQKRWCLIFSQEILTNKTQFGLDCLGPELQKIPVWSNGVNADLNTYSVDYQNSLTQSTKLFTDFKNNYYNSVFNLYQPYIRTKTRLFDFSNLPSPNPAQIDNFNLLYSGVNSKGPNWNNKIKLD